MERHNNVYTIITRLVEDWPAEAEQHSEALAEARAWLKNHKNNDVRTLARDTLEPLDRLLHTLEGGTAFDTLLNARAALTRYANRDAANPGEPSHDNDTLTIKLTPAGGVTLVRKGQHLTINDEALEHVRDVINERRRELRKRQRRGLEK